MTPPLKTKPIRTVLVWQLIATAVAEDPYLINYLYIVKINPNVQVMLLPQSANIPLLLPLPTMGPFPSATATPTPEPTPTPLPTATP